MSFAICLGSDVIVKGPPNTQLAVKNPVYYANHLSGQCVLFFPALLKTNGQHACVTLFDNQLVFKCEFQTI